MAFQRSALIFFCVVVTSWALVARAANSFNCEGVWAGASANNSVSDCLKDSVAVESNWYLFVLPGFVTLLVVCFMVVFPLLFCCCVTNGCGTTCLKSCLFPTNVYEHYNARPTQLLWALLGLLWSIGCVAAIMIGGSMAYSGASASSDSIIDPVAGYYNNTAIYIEGNATKGDASQTLLSPDFADQVNVVRQLSQKFTDFHSTVDDNVVKYVRIWSILSYCIGWLPLVFAVGVWLMHVYRVSGGVPTVCSWVTWLLGLVFGVIAVLVLLCAGMVVPAGEEVQLQKQRAPGVLQWYVVPWLQQKFGDDLNTLATSLKDARAKSVAAACPILISATSTQKPSQPDKFFITEPITCRPSTTLEQLVATVNSAVASDASFCTPQSNSKPADAACSLVLCAEKCRTPPGHSKAAQVLAAQTSALRVMDAVGSATSIQFAYNLVVPIRDLDAVVDFASHFVFETYSTYSKTREGLFLAGAGYFCAMIVFIVATFVLLRGRVVWGDYRVPK